LRTRVRELAAETAASPDGLRLVVLDGRTSPSIDVTAAGMLVQLRTDIHRLGAELVMSDDVGQVRDVLAVAEPDGEPPLYRTVSAALAAAREDPQQPFTPNG
jgi:SulP family sulfate permease